MTQSGNSFSNLIIICVIAAFSSLCQSCKHNDLSIKSPGSSSGISPSLVVNFNLEWGHILHNIEFSTKASSNTSHRFIFEVFDGAQTVARETVYLNDKDFAEGNFSYPMKTGLEPKLYNLAVWYDKASSGESSAFDSDDLTAVTINNFSTTDAEALQCAYASELLDLRGESQQNPVHKDITLAIPGARFELIATDVLQFIADQKEALNADEKFYANVKLFSPASTTFNARTGNVVRTGSPFVFSGWMRLPFDNYTELKIAEGFFFCHESEVTAQLSITNSALVTVSQTESFSFPVKPGSITSISGEFLTHPIDGVFSLNNVWAGDIPFTP